MKKHSIPFIKPRIRAADYFRAFKSLNSGWLTHGPYTREFEELLSSKYENKSAIFTASCTASLEIALILADLHPGDEVITTPLTWVATSNVILHNSSKVVFVDVDLNTGLLRAEDVEKAITNRTKAIIVVHLHGQMVDMQKFANLGIKYNVKIIEDSAHCLEGSRNGVAPGQLGFAAAFSFHAAKNITSGQGGALVVANTLKEQVLLARRDGVKNNNQDIRVMESWGGKYDSTDFQAALLIGQLKRVSKQHSIRIRNLEIYQNFFTQKGIRFPITEDGVVHAAHMMVIHVDKSKRNRIRQRLIENQIQTSVHYPAIHLEPYYQKRFGYQLGDFPNAEELGFTTISLPMFATLTEREVLRVCKSVIQALEKD
jgi:dTDP-4-amino-4,6-dideoxygalactose transaminase